MRTIATPTAVLTAILTVLVLALPATAEGGDGTDEGPALNEACENTDGKTVVTLDEPFSDAVDTPVMLMDPAVPAGTGAYLIDLEGLPQGERRTVNMTLTMLTAGVEATPVSDYDLVVNGNNELKTSQPEKHSISAKHCQTIYLDVEVFSGTPADTLTLDVAISNFAGF